MQQPIGKNEPKIFSTAKENQYFDRKSARKDTKEISRHICAFANASGGKLVIGIEDDGEITGFRRNGAHDIEGFKQAPLVCCEPVPVVRASEIPVVNSRGEDDLILVLDVSASTDHVIARRSDGAVFLRQGDNSVVLCHDQITALEYDKNQRRFEDEVAVRSSIEDVDPEVMARYKEELGTDVSDEQVLRSRSMLVDGHLTNAGVLLFAKHPTQFIPCARVRVVRLDGSKMETGRRLNIVKDRTFDGPLPKVVEGAKAMISEQLREFQYLGDDGRFKIIPEYPEFAWFEGLVNAVTHRNYAHSGDHIRVMMYDDRMKILSPGKLPNVVTLSPSSPSESSPECADGAFTMDSKGTYRIVTVCFDKDGNELAPVGIASEYDTGCPFPTFGIVSSDNSALMRNIARHEHALEVSLAGISRAVLHCARAFGEGLPDEGTVAVSFDDSIITDTAAEKRLAMEEVGVTLHPYEYRMRFYGEDERTARERAEGLGAKGPGGVSA